MATMIGKFGLATLVIGIMTGALHADLSLKEQVQVDGDYITAGDLFYGADPAQDTILREAPAPGERMILTRRTLTAMAADLGETLDLPNYLQRIVVTRSGTPLKKSMVAELLYGAALDGGAEAESRIQIFGGVNNIQLPLGYGVGDVTVRDFDLSPQTGRISAVLSVPSGLNRMKQVSVNARLQALRTVPTLVATLMPGEIIKPEHIEWQAFEANRVGRSIVQSETDLIGLTVRRTLKPGTMIRSSDVQRALVIKKGAIVTMVFKHGSISLTALGKALESGGQDDIIRLTNHKSGQAVEARILSPDQVEVLHGPTFVAARN